jgi:flagellar hook protein FlgE
MSFQQGLSGLNAAAKSLDVISNNVANASTIGFKQSHAQFADVYANSLSGSGAAQVGIGTTVRTVAQEFAQGNVSVTNNPLDLAINGNGFFRLSTAGAVSYSRNGQFHLDKDGYIVNAQGARLTGFMANTNGVPMRPATELQLDDSNDTVGSRPSATKAITAQLNLNSDSALPKNATFDVTDPESYNSSTSIAVYDSQGMEHTLAYYFVKTATATPNTWDVHVAVDGAAAATTQLGFDTRGALTAGAAQTISWPLGTKVDPLVMAVDFTGTTQFGSSFAVNALSQDGYASGKLSGLSVGSDGTIQGRYTNGRAATLAQVALANFQNPQGLQPAGDNAWVSTADAGAEILDEPGTGTLGVLQSAAVEDSNVDLTAELVNMITAQRVYQANAQSIKTQDAVLQTLVNLR